MLERDTGERKDYAARWFDTLYMTKQLGEPTRNKKSNPVIRRSKKIYERN